MATKQVTFKGRSSPSQTPLELTIPIETTWTEREIAEAVRNALHFKLETEGNDWLFEKTEKKKDKEKVVYYNQISERLIRECQSNENLKGNDKILVDDLHFYHVCDRLSWINMTRIGGNATDPSKRVFDPAKFAIFLRKRGLDNDTRLTNDLFISEVKRFSLIDGLDGRSFDVIQDMIANNNHCTISISLDATRFFIDEFGYWFDPSSNEFTTRKYISTVEGCKQLIESQLLGDRGFGSMSREQVYAKLRHQLRMEWRHCGLLKEQEIMCEKMVGPAITMYLDRFDKCDKLSKSDKLDKSSKSEKGKKMDEEKRGDSLENDMEFGRDLASVKEKAGIGDDFDDSKLDDDEVLYWKVKNLCTALGEKYGALPINKKKCNIDCINRMNVERFVKYGWQKRNVRLFLAAMNSSINMKSIHTAYMEYDTKFSKCSKEQVKEVLGYFGRVPTKTGSKLISNMMRLHFGDKTFQVGLMALTQSRNLGLSQEQVDDLSEIAETIEPQREEMVLSLLNGDIALTVIDKLELKIYHLLFGLILKKVDSAELVGELNKFKFLKTLFDAIKEDKGTMGMSVALALKKMVQECEAEFVNLSVNDQKFWMQLALLYFEQTQNGDEALKFLVSTLTTLTDAMLKNVNVTSAQDALVSAFATSTHKMKNKMKMKRDNGRCGELVKMLSQRVQKINEYGQLLFVRILLGSPKTDLNVFLPLIHNVLWEKKASNHLVSHQALIAINWHTKVQCLNSLPTSDLFSYVNSLPWMI